MRPTRLIRVVVVDFSMILHVYWLISLDQELHSMTLDNAVHAVSLSLMQSWVVVLCSLSHSLLMSQK